jgi:hypothetical protein
MQTNMERFVAFLDILGFKELVENNSVETLQRIYLKTLEAGYRSGVDEAEAFGFPKELTSSIRSIIISDSIIFWSQDLTMDSFMMLTSIVRAFCREAFYTGIVLRGGIAKGPLEETSTASISKYNTIRAPIILGRGLTNAWNLESSQQWSGCVISDEVIDHLRTDTNSESTKLIEKIIELKWIVSYKAPMKKGNVKDYFCLNWVGPRAENITEESIEQITSIVREKFSAFSKNDNTWEVEVKIKNTIDFILYCWKQKPPISTI